MATLALQLLRRPFHRLTATFFMVIALLFAQLALAGYACPTQAKADAMTEMMAFGEPCEGTDQSQPVLCHQHPAGNALSFEAVKLSAASLPVFVQVLVLQMVLKAIEAINVPVTASSEAQPALDPIFLSTLRLRV